jgi:hypothetical protein
MSEREREYLKFIVQIFTITQVIKAQKAVHKFVIFTFDERAKNINVCVCQQICQKTLARHNNDDGGEVI